MENQVENSRSSNTIWWIVGISAGVIIVLALLALIAMMFGVDVSGGLIS